MTACYITTTLPYVNAQPHIGHTLEFVQADVIARRKRLQLGIDKVHFNVGTDEHGLKMYQKAAEKSQNVQDFVDANAQTFINFCELFDISYNSFYRTSDPAHYHVAQSMRSQCDQNGDIYEKEYTGLYCIGCESFKTEKELVDGKCPDHNKEPIPYHETNYFFRLSNYRQTILDHIGNNNFIIPAHKNKELANFVAKMEDISVSRRRQNLPRGVPVPNDDDQVMYVWFDALSNYVGAVGFPDDTDKLRKFRGTHDAPTTIQLCGPDNLRFQGAIRQGMLASAGLPPTQKILVHGMIYGPDGNKMSKTLGNVISPFDQREKFGLQALRYYLIAGIPTYGDAAYKEDDLLTLYNAHLANSFGNLLNRVIHLANKKDINLQPYIQQITESIKIYHSGQDEVSDPESLLSTNVLTHITTTRAVISDSYNTYQLYDAAQHTHKLVMRANKYMDEHKPRDKELTPEQATQILGDLAALLYIIVQAHIPIIPGSCTHALHLLATQTKDILFPKLEK